MSTKLETIETGNKERYDTDLQASVKEDAALSFLADHLERYVENEYNGCKEGEADNRTVPVVVEFAVAVTQPCVSV
ncbi:hypothetical protein ACJ73_07702 [Blastomyces percursus]|uniref:Uncharacterized protein n=1 Tax=Blastomyces percursus TaxID=1658174 RepID=A0A1J9R059_9EURO|nr:hypothetical protein ACJ73_07702 [Blastomyces percursus]